MSDFIQELQAKHIESLKAEIERLKRRIRDLENGLAPGESIVIGGENQRIIESEKRAANRR